MDGTMKKAAATALLVLTLFAAETPAFAKGKAETAGAESERTKGAAVQAQDIDEYAAQAMFAVGVPNDGFAQYFSGKSWISVLNTSSAFVANVTFEPGCVNNWHVHHSEAQILIGVGGRGWVQIEGEEARAINPGDVICVEPGLKHWHGAAKDSWFSHLSISAPKSDGSGRQGTDWLEPLDRSEYAKLD